MSRYEILFSELTVSKNCNHLLSERIVQLERNAPSNAQYHHQKSPIPPSVGDDVLESRVCKAQSLTSYEVKHNDLQACHRLKKKDTVIVKFKCCKEKHNILINRKNLCNKSDVLTQLNFSGRHFVSESMCHEIHQSSYKCRQLKNPGKIHSTWFWNISLNFKLDERSQPTKIHHVTDIEKFLGVDNLGKLINNTSF